MRNIIFYHPKAIVENPRKGSELRPKKMKEAFENIGYRVDLAVGDSKERKIAFNQIKESIEDGKEYDFMYAESSNMPIPLADSHHLPLRPLQDFNFFRMLNSHSIPIGFFYRDIFWQVQELHRNLHFFKKIPKQIFHWLEWYGLKKTVNHLFLPSGKIDLYLPTDWPNQRSVLYPGCTPAESVKKPEDQLDHERIRLFYVGGIEPTLYNLEPLLQVVSKTNGVQLRLCCREDEWNKYSGYYQKFDLSNVEILHATSSELDIHYNWADLVMCLWTSDGYINITMPIKIIETVGYNVPLILLEGSESAQFVKKEGVGWVVKDIAEAKELLVEFIDDRSEIVEKVKNLKKISKNHTWEKRAEQAAETLTRPV